MSTDRSERRTGGESDGGWALSPADRQLDRSKVAGVERLTAIILYHERLNLEAVEQVLTRLDIRVAGKATTPKRALALVVECRPDLLVADIEIGDSDSEGIACLRQARQHVPHLKTITLSASEDPDRITAAFLAGASAYVHKRSHPDDLVAAIRQLFERSIFFAGDRGWTTDDRHGRPRLTRRELEILRLVAEGKSNADAARTLWITEQTVKFHLSNIYRKLGVPNRTAAAHWAHAHLGQALERNLRMWT
jgi:DNA-binding NarL/FixJ family response regulator